MGHNGTNDTRETRSYNRPKFNKQMKISKKNPHKSIQLFSPVTDITR